MVIRLLGLWLILTLPVYALENIQATTDASRLYEQQSLLLTITADDQLEVGALDIRPLFRAFIVGEVHFATSSQGSQFTSQWQIPLLPLHAGVQQIPPLPLAGYMSQALPLQVLKGLPPKSQPGYWRSVWIAVSCSPTRLHSIASNYRNRLGYRLTPSHHRPSTVPVSGSSGRTP